MAAEFVVSTCKKTALTFFRSVVVRCVMRESNNREAIPFRRYCLSTPRDKM